MGVGSNSTPLQLSPTWGQDRISWWRRREGKREGGDEAEKMAGLELESRDSTVPQPCTNHDYTHWPLGGVSGGLSVRAEPSKETQAGIMA